MRGRRRDGLCTAISCCVRVAGIRSCVSRPRLVLSCRCLFFAGSVVRCQVPGGGVCARCSLASVCSLAGRPAGPISEHPGQGKRRSPWPRSSFRCCCSPLPFAFARPVLHRRPSSFAPLPLCSFGPVLPLAASTPTPSRQPTNPPSCDSPARLSLRHPDAARPTLHLAAPAPRPSRSRPSHRTLSITITFTSLRIPASGNCILRLFASHLVAFVIIRCVFLCPLPPALAPAPSLAACPLPS